MAKLKCIDELVKDFAENSPPRAGSLIISIFGDSISQHGNSVWLGSLIAALEPFGLNQRQIRTAVFRLVQEGWLVARQIRRRSYYSFTDFGSRHYEKAARRIYAAGDSSWDGNWVLVMPAFVSNSEKEVLRRELLWLGYGALSAAVLAHPSADRCSLDETLQELDLVQKVIVLQANTTELASREALKRLTHTSWRLDEIEPRYMEFLTRFRAILAAVKRAKRLEHSQCFQVRTLLIHQYRRILLHDADLPEELLPANWPGRLARRLAANLYRLVHKGAMEFITANMETVEGNLPPADDQYYARFGRLV